MPRRSVALLALAALALTAVPAFADKDSFYEKEIDEESEIVYKYEDETTDSFGGKWPITKGILGCTSYDSENEVCDECLEPYFTLNEEDGVCDCSEGFGLAPFVYGKSKKPKLMVCAPCPQGTYSAGGSYSTTLCKRCPVGSTTSTPFANDVEDCDVCLPGFADYVEGEGCTLCAAGTYADEDTGLCEPCPDGFTTPKAGSTSEDQCYIAVCEEDEQSVKGQCYPCADGYVSDMGNAAFGKYQPKCVKDKGPRDQKPLTIPTGKLYKDKDGYVGEQKIHDKDPKVPDWDDDHVPKIKGVDTGYDKYDKYDDSEEVVVAKKTA